MPADVAVPSREALVHQLYEAAELEHNLMCTYLYAAFSLKDGVKEGLTEEEAAAVARWRSTILRIAIEEMGHLTAVWNITASLGAQPRFGRANFPLDPGILPAGVVVKLAPFSENVLQHFIHLERPDGSEERDGEGFVSEFPFKRGVPATRVTPMPLDYDTVGAFYAMLDASLRAFVEKHGESAAFCGDPSLQLSTNEVALGGAKPVLCSKTALGAFKAIVEQGEGAPLHSTGSHYQLFVTIREEYQALKAKNPAFVPAFPAATNPVLRRPLRAEGRVWLENEASARTVDVANSAYALMLRLLAYSYMIPRPLPEKALVVDVGVGLMRVATHLAERAARMPAGPSNPSCNAGMSFTALRDAAPLPPGPGARRFFSERLDELIAGIDALDASGDERVERAGRILRDLTKKAKRGFAAAEATKNASGATTASSAPSAPGASAPPGGSTIPAPSAAVIAPASGSAAPAAASSGPPVPTVIDGVEHIPGKKLNLLFETKRCIHARFCVTGAPKVFLANVQGPWINPDEMDAEALVGIAHACPSGAIRYERNDDRPNETAAPVNLLSVREAGPYAVRGAIALDGEPMFRATLCRCGASKNKPYCDGSHHDAGFHATGEPPTGKADMLPVRDGPLAIDPETDGPLHVRGNLEITSGTGRVVARVTQARMCRCGGSNTKPFCDGTHAKIGFKSV